MLDSGVLRPLVRLLLETLRGRAEFAFSSTNTPDPTDNYQALHVLARVFTVKGSGIQEPEIPWLMVGVMHPKTYCHLRSDSKTLHFT